MSSKSHVEEADPSRSVRYCERQAWDLFAEALLLRVMESLSHAPEFIIWPRIQYVVNNRLAMLTMFS